MSQLVTNVAVINSGGKGSRLAEVSNGLPKALATVFSRPILRDQLLKLSAYGITHVILILAHKKECIIEFIEKDCVDIAMDFTFLIEEEPLGSGGGILQFYTHLPERFFFLYCDIFFDFDIDYLSRFHAQADADISLILQPNDHPFDSDLVTVDDTGKIENIYPHPHDQAHFPGNLVNAAFYLINKNVLDNLAKETRAIDFAQGILPLLIASNAKIYGYKTLEYLQDMGTPERLDKVHQTYQYRVMQDKKMPAVFLECDTIIKALVPKLTSASQNTNGELTDVENNMISDLALTISHLRRKGYCIFAVCHDSHKNKSGITSKEYQWILHQLEWFIGLKGQYLDHFCFYSEYLDADKGTVSAEKCDHAHFHRDYFSEAQRFLTIDKEASWYVGSNGDAIDKGREFGINICMINAQGAPTAVGSMRFDKWEPNILSFAETALTL